MDNKEFKFEGRFISVKVEESRFGMYEIVIGHSPFGGEIIAIHKDDVLLVEQFRHPTGLSMWELPGGAVDTTEDPLLGAIREAEEEVNITFKPEDLTLVSVRYPVPSLMNVVTNTYLGHLPDDFDRTTVIHQASELDDARWFNIDELIENYKKDPASDINGVVGSLLQAKALGLI